MSIQDRQSETTSVKVLHAGSLTSLVRQGIGPALYQESGITLESLSGHSVALATALKDQRTSGDVFLSADAAVNQTLMGPTNGDWIQWFVIFARNAVVLAYSPISRFFADFEQARVGKIPWYQVLLQPGVKMFRNDPNLDPLGYYTLLVCALAQEHYRLPDLKQRLLGSDTNPAQVNHLNLAQLEGGEIDAMFLYLSAAGDLALPYLALPDEINLSNPAMATTYAGVHYTTDKGQAFHGKPISFSAAVLKNANNPQAAQHFIEFLLSPIGQRLVQAAHFLPSPALVGGDTTSIPGQLQTLLQGKYEYPD
ncbi:MAG TPA: extracellular solute-binding protein [Ktedonobacteraceae bacterium]